MGGDCYLTVLLVLGGLTIEIHFDKAIAGRHVHGEDIRIARNDFALSMESPRFRRPRHVFQVDATLRDVSAGRSYLRVWPQLADGVEVHGFRQDSVNLDAPPHDQTIRCN